MNEFILTKKIIVSNNLGPNNCKERNQMKKGKNTPLQRFKTY